MGETESARQTWHTMNSRVIRSKKTKLTVPSSSNVFSVQHDNHVCAQCKHCIIIESIWNRPTRPAWVGPGGPTLKNSHIPLQPMFLLPAAIFNLFSKKMWWLFIASLKLPAYQISPRSEQLDIGGATEADRPKSGMDNLRLTPVTYSSWKNFDQTIQILLRMHLRKLDLASTPDQP